MFLFILNSKDMATFHKWKYNHYFDIEDDVEEVNSKNITVRCRLCLPRIKTLSTSKSSTSNLFKHLTSKHANMKLKSNVDDNEVVAKQPKIDVTLGSKGMKVGELVAEYVINDMRPLSEIESPSFIKLLRGVAANNLLNIPCKKTLIAHINKKFEDHKESLIDLFTKIEYVCTTADKWTANNKSFFGMTAHWICPTTLIRKKAAIACCRFLGSHKFDTIASKISDVHSEFNIALKITATVTDNASNFVKAFRIFNVEQEDDEIIDEYEFTEIDEIFENVADTEKFFLPPHERCAAHTLNLVSKDIGKFISTRKISLFQTAIFKCTQLWNKSSRSTSAADIIEENIKLKLLVPTETRWNSQFNAIKRITDIDLKTLNNICIKLKKSLFTENEIKILKQYTAVAQPLADALDILQGEDYCYYGTLIPVLYTLKKKLSRLEDIALLKDLPQYIIDCIDDRFSKIMKDKKARLAALSHPAFKNLFTNDCGEKIELQNMLLNEMIAVNNENKTIAPVKPRNDTSFFDFDDESINTDVESEMHNYLISCKNISELAGYPTIKKIFLQYNTTLPSSAPVERLFSIGGHILTPHRNRLSDKNFEKLLILRYNKKK